MSDDEVVQLWAGAVHDDVDQWDARLAAYVNAALTAQFDAIRVSVEGVPRHDWSGGTLIDRNEALAAIALHDPRTRTEGTTHE